MVRRYRKRGGLRRRGGKRYLGARRRRGGVRVLAKKTHWFKEMCQVTSITAPPSGNGSGIMTFKLNDLTNAASFKNLFDLYKLTGVKVKIVPRQSVSDQSSTANAIGQSGTLPMLYIAENRDPYVPAPVGVGDILNDDGVKVIRMSKPINLYIRSPKARLYAGLATGSLDIPLQFNVGSKWQPWLCTGGNGAVVDQSNVEHFGFRWLINNGVGYFEQVFDVYATYYFAMKEQD